MSKNFSGFTPGWLSQHLAKKGKVPEVSAPTVCASFAINATTDEQKLNKTERGFYEILRRRAQWVKPHAITLKLADDTRYTADLPAVEDGVFSFYEVKGFMRDDARVKLLVAARGYPMFRFVLVRKVAGKFEEEEVRR